MRIATRSLSAALLQASVAFRQTASVHGCIDYGFVMEFEGTCDYDTILDAFTDQVFNAAGAVSPSCPSAKEALDAKLLAAGVTADDVCTLVHQSAPQAPFTDAANRGTDLKFERLFFNGRTDWQEEVETVYETENGEATSILKEDASAVNTFYRGVAQSVRVEWPGSLTNFQSSAKDTLDQPTCTTNAAMCCWPKDRQANDNNGNCNNPYDTQCVDKDPADNTNLCFVDMARSPSSNEFNSNEGLVLFPGDNDDGEGDIHCHGLAWSNNVNDHTARYRGNNLFYVAMYDHMHQRGYVENIPGAPMCGCVEQMPTVSRSDCTQVDLTESFKVVYNSDTNKFSGRVTHVEVDFNSCQGINNKNNDLWAYMGRLFYQDDITAAQFSEAGRIITNNGCDVALEYELDRRGLTRGYNHDSALWTNVAGRGALQMHGDYGKTAFREAFLSNNRILYRACATCVETHKHVYYRRLTDYPDSYDLLDTILYDKGDVLGMNTWNGDFTLHSTYEDALSGANPWKCPNNFFNHGAGFTGNCSPDGSQVNNQGSKFSSSSSSPRTDVAYYVNKPEDAGLQMVDTTAIQGRDWASGLALEASDGTIYLTGSGRDIWDSEDDFNFYSQSAEGDHTVIVHVSSFSSPYPDYWMKAGIMFRKDMDPSSPHAMVYLGGSSGVCGIKRTGARYGDPNNKSTESLGCQQQGATAAWLKLEKRVDTYTYFVGNSDGTGEIAWSELWSADIPLIGENYYIGLAVTSKRSQAAEAVFDNYYTDRFHFPSAAPSTSPAPTAFVPSLDIGYVGIEGKATQSSPGSWHVEGSGADIWNQNDGFHFVEFSRSGDVSVSLLIESFTATNSWAKAGVMIRDTLDDNSSHFSMFLTRYSGLANQYRLSTNAWSSHQQPQWTNPSSVWVRVTKIGNTFQAYFKHVGDSAWTAFGVQQQIDFTSTTFKVGIAVTSHNNYELAYLESSNFEISTPGSARGLRGL